VIGTLPPTFVISVNNGILTINVGNTNYYASGFKYIAK
jgi:hypothetical protein